MTSRQVVLSAVSLCALVVVSGCETPFRRPPLSEHVQNLKPSAPPGARRDSAYWVLKNVHKLRDDQKKILTPLLTELLIGDDDLLVRGYVAATLGKLRAPDGIPALTGALQTEKNALVRCDVVKALVDYKDESLMHVIVQAAETDREPDVRQTALIALADMGGKGVIPPLIDGLGDRDNNVVFTASECLGRLTGQNFGFSQQAWRDWWRENADKPLGAKKSAKKTKKAKAQAKEKEPVKETK